MMDRPIGTEYAFKFKTDPDGEELTIRQVITKKFESFKDPMIASWNQEYDSDIKLSEADGLNRCAEYLERDFVRYTELYTDPPKLESDVKERFVQRYGSTEQQANVCMRIIAAHLHSQTDDQALKNRFYEFERNLPRLG